MAMVGYDEDGAAIGLPQAARYTKAQRVVHWIVAVLILGVWPLGILIGFVAEPHKPAFYNLHESFGFLVLWIMLARLALRLVRGSPLHQDLPALQKRLAHAVHMALYGSLIAMPVFGFLATNAYGYSLSLFGVLPVWSPIGKDAALAPVFMEIHEWLGWTILSLFVLHMAGVLYHHVVRRDTTLYRMT